MLKGVVVAGQGGYMWVPVGPGHRVEPGRVASLRKSTVKRRGEGEREGEGCA